MEPIETLELEELDALEEGEFDGARLRRARLRNGVELDEIAGVTKVNPTYLRFIEEERFEDLPAAVYVRGFVMGYASCIGLDPSRVAKSYMRRFQNAPENPRRGRGFAETPPVRRVARRAKRGLGRSCAGSGCRRCSRTPVSPHEPRRSP